VQRLVDFILNSGLRPPLFHPDVLALDRELPRSEVLAVLLLQRRGEMTMSELAEDLQAPLSTATGIGSRLVRRGLVSRERHPDDRRVIRLHLTPKGKALAARLRKHVDALVQRVQAALSEEEIGQLIVLVGKVVRAFRVAAPTEEPGPGMRRIPIED
jgi:DNA-binding MarR family transcriptional regulator